MNTTTLGLRSLAAGLVLAGTIAVPQLLAVDAYSDPVGYHSLPITGASDNVMSLPMVRDAVFSGSVAAPITANSFNVLAGPNPPNPAWTNNQFVYSQNIQRLTYYVEFTSGTLKGLYYKVTANGAASLTLDTEGDNLTNHPVNGAAAALAAGDSIKIRPYWTVQDVLQIGNAPVIEAWPDPDTSKDELLIPNYTSVGQNKAANINIHFDSSLNGWRTFGDDDTSYADFILRPNEAFIIRRRNAASISVTNLGAVLLNRAISFIPGGSSTKNNDTFISVSRPSSVSLAASGLWNANPAVSVIQESTDSDNPSDLLLAFPTTGSGYNRAANRQYYYLAGTPAGQGWRLFPDDVTDVGASLLEPGKAYIVRKKVNNVGRDWVNDPNY